MKKSKATAIISFVSGLTFWIPIINVVFGVLAIYLGIKALAKIRKDPDKYGGKGFAIAGIVLGTFPIIFYIIGLTICLIGYKEICRIIGLTFLA